MAIKILKSLATRIRNGSGQGANAKAAGNSGSDTPRKAQHGKRRGPKQGAATPKLDGKEIAASSGETWRPGDKSPGNRRSASSKPKSESSAPPRRRRKPGKRKPRPIDDSTILSQPDDAPEASKPERPVKAPESQEQPKTPESCEQSKPRAQRQRPPRKRRPRAESGAEKPTKPAEPQKPWSIDDYKVDVVEGKTRFHDVGLSDEILHAVSELGFEYCTPIQARVLQEVADGHNVAGRAQTGTGKTAAFLLLTFKQFLQNPLPKDRPCGRPRALVIAPTRELVVQIMRDAESIGKYCGMRSMAVYGGTDYEKQERALLKSPIDLIAATPGRLLDFQRKGKIDLKGVEILVIDEADRMLDMGFIPDVRTIIRCTPPKEKRRSLLFSATLTDDVMRLASQWMPDPHVVEIEPDQVAVDTVKQLVYMVRANQKFTVLHNLLKRPNIGRVLIFANRRDQTERIAFELKRYGIECELLSGAVNQNRRERVLEDFRSGKVMTVVATDVAGRGLHVDDIDHVVNFDLPYEAEDYVHRIGRTGRAGAEGTAVSFACEDESFTIPEIEKYIGEELSCKYAEESLLKPLPHTNAKQYVRPPRTPNRGGRSGGGGRRGGPRSGPPRRR
ncbi:MAG: DEAD/DEAH box helicase [Verrucomicrobia bacterium]|nr:DEAD/DEAH box helicase [Verrucomicrobiota bacterium]